MTTSTSQALLNYFPPMGVYETLFKFMDACGCYMGEPGTHPWAQGFPLTTQLPGGPELPGQVEFESSDLKYPPATGIPPMIDAVVNYFNHFYNANITADNVAIFAGGRPGIFATIAFLPSEIPILIEETEYTPYYDVLEVLKRNYSMIPSNVDNRFAPDLDEYRQALTGQGRAFFIKSNPCNPTGMTWSSETLKEFVDLVASGDHGALIDEAYEFYNQDGAQSAMSFIENIDDTNIFVVGAATKGLQVPGMRIGWVIASKKHVEIFRNYSSFGMGGVSRPSQLYVSKLLELGRVEQARNAVRDFFNEQRDWYREGLSSLGLELFTGTGGFYHWARLPGDQNADQLNERLFEHNAAILPGRLCDMFRRGENGPSNRFIRFSFGPLLPETREENLRILGECLA